MYTRARLTPPYVTPITTRTRSRKTGWRDHLETNSIHPTPSAPTHLEAPNLSSGHAAGAIVREPFWPRHLSCPDKNQWLIRPVVWRIKGLFDQANLRPRWRIIGREKLNSSVYRIADSNTIEIIGIPHQRMGIERHLFRENIPDQEIEQDNDMGR